MNKKTYITPQTTLVKCHIEGVMQQLSKTGGESKVDPNTPIALHRAALVEVTN